MCRCRCVGRVQCIIQDMEYDFTMRYTEYILTPLVMYYIGSNSVELHVSTEQHKSRQGLAQFSQIETNVAWVSGAMFT